MDGGFTWLANIGFIHVIRYRNCLLRIADLLPRSDHSFQIQISIQLDIVRYRHMNLDVDFLVVSVTYSNGQKTNLKQDVWNTNSFRNVCLRTPAKIA